MSKPHWNYFLAIEDDMDRIGRYVEFAPENFGVYSIEMARLLMAATQEIDVLLKQLCTLKGSAGDSEQDYREVIPKAYPNFPKAEVQVTRFGLSFVPFSAWATKAATPAWWTANNKVKHERHTHFANASLENMLNSVCALLIANLYYHDANKAIDGLFPGTKHLDPIGMVPSVSPTRFGLMPNYKII